MIGIQHLRDLAALLFTLSIFCWGNMLPDPCCNVSCKGDQKPEVHHV